MYRNFAHHKATNQGYVTLNGQRHYLGVYDKPETLIRYNRMISEWLANDRHLPVAPEKFTVTDLAIAYMKYVLVRYVNEKTGKPTATVYNTRLILRRLRANYGDLLATKFTALQLKTLEISLAKDNLARATIRYRINRIKHMFRWAVNSGLVPASCWASISVHQGIENHDRSVNGTPLKPIKIVRPVSVQDVEATLPFLTPVLRSMVRLQLITVARPGEICMMRPCDIDTTEDVWRYTPQTGSAL